MDGRRRVFAFTNLWIVSALAAQCVLTPTLGSAQEGEQRRWKRALLIGVHEYPNLPRAEQLQGCANDVEAMGQMLVERFRFRDEDLVRLVNSEATSEGIRSAFKRLVREVEANATEQNPACVVIHFSGHGSQVRDQASGHADCDEEDGLDETLVPYDATRQGSERDIRDDELHTLIEKLCADAKARVFVTLDCCHAGTATRGMTRVRRLKRSVSDGVEGSDARRSIQPRSLPEGAVVLSACKSHEQEPEYLDSASGKHFGQFSYFLTQTLMSEQTVSRLSYRLLHQAIMTRYRSNRLLSPTPHIEWGGDAASDTVLGGGSDHQTVWTVVPAAERGSVTIQAGAFHGVTAGSEFELFGRPEDAVGQRGDSAEPLALLLVKEVDGVSSTAETMRRVDGDTYPIRLPGSFERGFAVLRHHEHGDSGIALRVVRTADEENDGPALGPDDQLPPAVKRMLESVHEPGETKWIRWVQDESCDLLLRIDGDFAALFAATGNTIWTGPSFNEQRPYPESLRGGWAPTDLRTGDEAVERLKDALRRITRALNLIRVASRQKANTKSKLKVRIVLDAIEVNDRMEIVGRRVWTTKGDETPVIGDDDYFGLRVVNDSDEDFYVTVVQINSDMGIDQLWPYQKSGQLTGNQLVRAGRDRPIGEFQCCRYADDEPPQHGERWVIALATRSRNLVYDLSQSTLPRYRSGSAWRGVESLEELLLQQSWFQTRAGRRPRGRRTLFDHSWGASLLTWIAGPEASDP